MSLPEMQIVLNMAEIRTIKNLPFYKYDVKIELEFREEKLKDISKERYDISKAICYIIMKYLIREKGLNSVAYNRASVLYSIEEFDEFEMSFSPTEIPDLAQKFPNAFQVHVSIKPSSNFQAFTNDLKSCVHSQPDFQPNLLEVLNILIENEANCKTNIWDSKNGVMFKNDSINSKELSAGIYVKLGLKTAVDVVGETMENLRLAITADLRALVLHEPQNLSVKLDQLKNAGCYNLSHILKGVYVITSYGMRVPWAIQAINSQMNISTPIGSKRISNIDYFRQKYGIQLTRTDLPLIGKYDHGMLIWFPAEVLEIVPYQSVSEDQQLPIHQEIMAEFSRKTPEERLQLTKIYMKELGLFDSGNLEKFGFNITPIFFELKANVLTSVRINDKLPVENKMVKAKNEKYYRAPRLPPWAIVNYGCERGVFLAFKTWILEQLIRKGVSFSSPPGEVNATGLKSEMLLKNCQKAGYKFVIIVLAKADRHDEIKFYEKECQIVTQLINVNTMEKVIIKKHGSTGDLIVLKTCLKNGGIPYGPVDTAHGQLRIMTDDNLYIGITFSHLVNKEPNYRTSRYPAQIGFSATSSFHPNQIVGDFMFIDHCTISTVYPLIALIVERNVQNFIKKRSKPTVQVIPKIIVIYMRKFYESHWKMIEKPLLPELQKILNRFSMKIQTIIVLKNKKTLERLYRTVGRDAPKPLEANIPAGLCLDHSVFNPAYEGFFLNPHSVNDGTARTAKFTVVVNEPNMDLKSIEYATHALCFLHSVCPTPTAEPAILTVANNCAQRGYSLLKYYLKINKIYELSAKEANRILTNPQDGDNTFRYSV